MVGGQDKKNEAIRPHFETDLGRFVGGANNAEFDMSG
jgi:hypothetical protein